MRTTDQSDSISSTPPIEAQAFVPHDQAWRKQSKAARQQD
jgi:hypothetical protein